MISEMQIRAAQDAWATGIVYIGSAKTWAESRDRASAFIQQMYVMDGTLLFFPTMTCQIQSRPNLAGALSYFVGRNTHYPEDHGFALRPWSAVRFDNAGFVLRAGMGLAMGNYYFTDGEGAESKVEFTFAYVPSQAGSLRIQAHHSALPYDPG
jgi:hypothetical protein